VITRLGTALGSSASRPASAPLKMRWRADFQRN